MRSFAHSRLVFCFLVMGVTAVAGCDSSSEDSDASFRVTLEGSGSGTLQTQSITLGLEIECRLTNGAVSGVCEDTFFPPESSGFIRVQAVPAPAMNFAWGSPCEQAQGAVCDVRYEVDGPRELNVRASFNVRTDRVVMTPPNAAMTMAGEEGAIVIVARAIDEDGDEVAGVPYTFEVDRPDVVNMTAETANSVRIAAVASGQAIVTATAQGVSGTAAVDVRLGN